MKAKALLFAFFLLSSFFPLPAATTTLYEQELACGEYYTLLGPEGEVLDKMGRVIYVGDEFIAEDDCRYRVTRVEGREAVAELVEKKAAPLEAMEAEEALAVQGRGGVVAIYHTHSDESYVPTDGKESIPANGGIFKVGKVFAAQLEELGVKTAHDVRPHEPHDAAAYLRSRRTAARLLRAAPAAIIDIHRDGVPDAGFYAATIAGQSATKVRFVVGQENPHWQTNLAFARRLKAVVDKKYPGLVKGIFLAKGSYNQDLSPRSLLVEVGTYTNSREEAQRGAALLAEALPAALGVATAKETSTAWRNALWLLLIFALGATLFLYVRTGSWQGVKEKVREFFLKEWHDLRGK